MHWEDVEQLAMDEAERDLADGAPMARPLLAAWAGEVPLLLAFLRDFEQGAYHDALSELLALTTPLGADRLAFAVTARAWSLDDPIPPVAEGVDLRQRVLMVERVDATRGAVEHRSVLIPFDEPVPDAPVRWRERQDLPGSEGWIASALAGSVSRRARRRGQLSDRTIAARAVRLVELGHLLALAPSVSDRLEPNVPQVVARP